jgi:hypothetical protein
MKKDKHPWITNNGGQIFNQPFFDGIDLAKWNEELPDMYSRINTSKDERSFVILLSLVIEYHADKLLRIIFPGYENLCNKIEMTFSIKLNLLQCKHSARYILPLVIFSAIFHQNL